MNLKDRFPTLFYDIVEERNTKGDLEEKRTEKAVAPSLAQVLDAVLRQHRVNPDVSVVSDLTQTVEGFYAEHVAAVLKQ